MEITIKGLGTLLNSLEEAKHEAKTTEDNYAKFSKRGAPMPTSENRSVQSLQKRPNSNLHDEAPHSKRPFRGNDTALQPARQITTKPLPPHIKPIVIEASFTRGGARQVTHVPQLGLSSVVEVAKQPTRADRLRELGGNSNKYLKEDTERGRRMMGLMLGHLNAARAEADKEKQSARYMKRREIEERVERQQKETQEEYNREKSELAAAQRQARKKMIELERCCNAARMFKVWAENQQKMHNYIRTTENPFVFYRPKQHNDETTKKLEETRRAIEEAIKRRKEKLEANIARLSATSDNGHVGDISALHDDHSPSDEEDVHSHISGERESHPQANELPQDQTLEGSLHGDSFSEGDVDEFSAPPADNSASKGDISMEEEPRLAHQDMSQELRQNDRSGDEQ